MGIAEVSDAKTERHIECFENMRAVQNAVDDLGAFVARVRGESAKEDTPRVQQAMPSLSAFLTDTPGHLTCVSEQIHVYLTQLRDLLF